MINKENEKEGKVGITFTNIVEKSNEMGFSYITSERERVMKILQEIYKDKVSVESTIYKNKSIEDICNNEEELYTDLSSNNQVLSISKVKEEEESVEKIEEEEESVEKSVEKIENNNKKYIRTNMQSFTKEKASITFVKNNYIIGHLISADLSVLDDFETLKEELDIVSNCFVTISKPLLIDNTNVIVRDTMLLAPSGKKSLSVIGSLYGSKLFKLDIGDRITNMKKYLKDDYEGFKKYAIQDSMIALIHGSFMESFNFENGVIGIPLTLSAISKNYLINYWAEKKYKGYQITPEYFMGDASKTITPKGLHASQMVGIKMSLYIANYKGGRNESFMYGIENDTI